MKEYRLLKKEVRNYIDYLEVTKQYNEQIQTLERITKWYKQENMLIRAVDLIQILAQSYETDRRYKKAATTWHKVGDLQSQEFLVLENILT
ncbi:MAG: hypothetical protein ACFE96_19030 [Candidatus Hermodarchaeota archaeon]